MTKILIIEDEEGVRKPLADHLKREGYEIILAQTGQEGDRSLKTDPDLVVMDWMLPDIQGIELLKKWRSQGIHVPTIMLTARTDLVDKVLGLELGANDYMTKPFEVRELVARIRVHLRVGQAHNSREQSEISISDIRLSLLRREVCFRDSPVEMTKTEFDLLRLFLENPNQVFSREELLKKVWGFNHLPTTRTVDTHVLQLRQKFESTLFETVHGIGYRFRAKK